MRIRKDLERVAGIEPAWPAWKAGTLPLSYTRTCYSDPILKFREVKPKSKNFRECGAIEHRS